MWPDSRYVCSCAEAAFLTRGLCCCCFIACCCRGNTHLQPLLGVAWDCGAVTTGPVTVPVLLALGVGVMDAQKQKRAAMKVLEDAALKKSEGMPMAPWLVTRLGRYPSMLSCTVYATTFSEALGLSDGLWPMRVQVDAGGVSVGIWVWCRCGAHHRDRDRQDCSDADWHIRIFLICKEKRFKIHLYNSHFYINFQTQKSFFC